MTFKEKCIYWMITYAVVGITVMNLWKGVEGQPRPGFWEVVWWFPTTIYNIGTMIYEDQKAQELAEQENKARQAKYKRAVYRYPDEYR